VRRLVITVAVAVLVFAPAVWPGAEDDFPLSTYPMFTSERGDVVSIDTAIGAGGERLSPNAIGGTDEPVLAAATVTNALRAGAAATERLCAEIAERAGRPVRIVTETHDTVALVTDGAGPSSVAVHAECAP